MSGIKGGKCGQKIQCQNPCKDPCQKVPLCVNPCQDPCTFGIQNHGSHHNHHGHHHSHKQDPCNPCCPDPCQDQGSYCCNK
ncbi:proline-rich protein 9-like [Bufo gargarizans]|uniref:proline-rich protein 9-like n=1 Tax=Bufo gargarizans TaxID=30331 RepID=UPI001CF4A00C|nr:proline-rich protein 9-like [Bufo gargarizans]XP_044152523.1 proline-rich protein 9-like [Bufo gargarizans]XP_044152960.1 proline-rich protein 9-like [Bufo gargarizans]